MLDDPNSFMKSSTFDPDLIVLVKNAENVREKTNSVCFFIGNSMISSVILYKYYE